MLATITAFFSHKPNILSKIRTFKPAIYNSKDVKITKSRPLNMVNRDFSITFAVAADGFVATPHVCRGKSGQHRAPYFLTGSYSRE